MKPCFANLLLAAVLCSRVFSSTSQVFYDAKELSASSPASASSLATLSDATFTTVAHPSFPAYSVRIKKSKFCDRTVNAYTGYIDVGVKHLFFYFFESRDNPDVDDVILWTNGGPGASSALGLFMELGPCRIQEDNTTKSNPSSWNSNANIFFIDQPVGVGFSYADYGDYVSTTEEAAKDVATFVSIFFEKFSKYEGRALHLSGESYGGRYIPLFASAIYDQNSKLIEKGLSPINLTSIMIGNGWTDSFRMTPSYYDMACTAASIPPILDISTCVRMKQVTTRCKKWVKEACIDSFDVINCKAANGFCSLELEEPFVLSGRNPYDISKDCRGGLEDSLCYPIIKSIVAYLNQKDVRETLGVDPGVGDYESINWEVNSAFWLTLDRFHETQHWIAMLLERNVRTLIYVGEYDWICNWVGNEAFTLAMEWSGQKDFVAEELGSWSVKNKTAGKLRSTGPLTFATIKGAGHMVPYDKPEEALAMVNRWIKEQPL